MDPTDRPEPGKVKPEEPLDRSQVGFIQNGIDGYGFGVYGAIGAYSGYDPSPPSSPSLFWWMRKDPTIVLAHCTVTAPIVAGSRSIEIVDDKGNESLAEKMKEAAEKELLPILDEGLFPACECLQFGYWLQEVIWDKIDGRVLPVQLNSVLPTEAWMHCDRQRRFAGFQIGDDFRDKRYGWLAVNQPHIHPVLGYARNEAAKYDWWGKINSNLTGDKLERKASGIQMFVGMPIGKSFVDTWTDSSGVTQTKQIFPQELVQRLINGAVTGQTMSYPLYAFKQQDIAAKPELATVPGIKIDRFDWGNLGPMLTAGIQRLDYRNQQIFFAYRRPPREAQEGKHGTNAESKSQAENVGVRDSEQVHQDRCTEFWNQVGKTWVKANYGEGPKIPVLKIQAAPLADQQQGFLQESVISLLTDRMTGPQIQDHIDQRKLLDDVEIPMVDEDTAAQNKTDREAQEAAQNAPQQANPAGQPQPAINPDRAAQMGVEPANARAVRLRRKAGMNGNGKH